MIGKNVLRFGVLLCFVLINLSCSSSYYHQRPREANNGEYDSGFPGQNTSDKLEEISNSIFRVSSIAFYRTYTFGDTSRIKKSDLSESLVKQNSIKSTVTDKPILGTGTLIYLNSGAAGILTCAHVVSFPDTIITYFVDSAGIFSDYIQSISFKMKQDIYVAGFPEGSEVNIILKDDALDVAFLGRQFEATSVSKFQVFNYPFGHSKELKWGTFVYLMGFPLNYKMVSRAVVGNPGNDKSGTFLIDAPVNSGFSGGIILALRDGVPNFELVGLIQSVPEEDENVLEPAAIDKKYRYSPSVPYKGLSYVNQLKLFNYGIAKAVPIDLIVNYLKKNKELLISKGYDLSIFRQ